MTPTADPYCFIESEELQPTHKVIYLIPETGERWQIEGTCNQCGECWQGAVGPAPVLDCPVRPDIKDNFASCTLSGFYLPKAAT